MDESADAAGNRGFRQRARALDVRALLLGGGAAEAIGQVKHHVASVDGPRHRSGIEKIGFDELHRESGDPHAVAKIRRRDPDAVPAARQRFDEARADESSRSSNENSIAVLHWSTGVSGTSTVSQGMARGCRRR